MSPPTLTRGAFAKPGTSIAFKTGSWRTEKPYHKHWAAPCHAACPAGEDAQAYIAKLQENRPREAWETIVRVNPMPSVTGRVCPHPCEQSCNRRHYDQPIAIHGIERYLGDLAAKNNWPYPMDAPKGVGGKIAVVGAGPAGLSAAYHLRRRGYQVTIFEGLPEAGGLMRTAIPPTRLPRDVLDTEIQRIFSLGMTLEFRKALGRDFSLEELRRDHKAVFLGIGTAKGKDWSIDGATPPNLNTGLELLKRWIVVGNVPTPKSVVIHGGGNTAVDLARVMKRAGVEEVHLVTASGLPGPDSDPGDTLNVVPREFDQAVEEGVIFHAHRTIQRLLMRGSKLVGIEMVRLKKLPQAGGRTARVAFEGTETVLHVEMVIPAIGEAVDPQGVESLLANRSYFNADPWGRIKNLPDAEGVFVGGDSRGDRGTVSAAIGDGRKAAQAIDAWLKGENLAAEEARREPVKFDKLNLHYFEKAARAHEPTLPVEERTDHKEIEGGFGTQDIAAEALRCFSCGNCLACDNCWTLCPDNAVVKTVDMASDGSHYVFDYEFCKGCGLCAKECPCGYIQMAADA